MKHSVLLSFEKMQAEILPACGMNTIRLEFSGSPVVRSPENVLTLGRDSCVYGIALLLPPNRTDRGRFSFDGRSYHLPINEPQHGNHLHGFLHEAAFRVLSCDSQSVRAEFRNSGELYPFPFCLTVEYRLDRQGYHQRFTFTNTGLGDMPLVFGLHSNFAEPDFFSAPIADCWERNARCISTGNLLELTNAERSYRNGTCPAGKAISGFYRSAGQTAQIGKVRYTVSRNFDQWTLWNGGGGQGFLSVEPQCGPVNALNSGGFLRLHPRESETFFTLLSPEEK